MTEGKKYVFIISLLIGGKLTSIKFSQDKDNIFNNNFNINNMYKVSKHFVYFSYLRSVKRLVQIFYEP